MEVRELIFFGILIIVGIIIILRDRKKSQRIIEQDKLVIKLLDDCIAFERELKKNKYSDKEIQEIKDEHEPEKMGDYSSHYTDWKKALFGN